MLKSFITNKGFGKRKCQESMLSNIDHGIVQTWLIFYNHLKINKLLKGDVEPTMHEVVQCYYSIS